MPYNFKNFGKTPGKPGLNIDPSRSGQAKVIDSQDSSKEWEDIKGFVGGRNKESKHPLQLEQERAEAKQPEGYYPGGEVGQNPFAVNSTPSQSPQLSDLMGLPTPQSTPMPQVAPTPIVPRGIPQSTPPPIPAAPSPISAPSDEDYNKQASGMLGGMNPDELKEFLMKVNKPTIGQTVGRGLAGFSDALMQGVAGAGPGHAQESLDRQIQQNRENLSGIPGKVAEAGKEQHGLSQQLQAKDPNSPFSRVMQNSERPNLLKMGWNDAQIRKTPAVAIQDAVKNGLGYEEVQAKYGLEREIHAENIGMQKAQLAQTGALQRGQQEIEKENQKLQHPFLSKFMGGNQPTTPSVPKVGDVYKGHVFLGGNPADKNSWRAQ